MSHIKTLAGGYKENSPRVRSESSKKPFIDTSIKMIDAQDLSNNIKGWYSEDKLTQNDIQLIISELQKL
jgi:hypothetical protein